MLLVKAHVENVRSIDDSGEVAIDPPVTALVGLNESGKTAFLNALDLTYSTRPSVGFEVDRDFPRKAVNEYRRAPDAKPAVATRLRYRLTDAEVAAVNEGLGFAYLSELEFTITHPYGSARTISLATDNAAYVQHLLAVSGLPADVRQACRALTTVRKLIEALRAADLNAEGKQLLDRLTARFTPTGKEWPNVIDHEIWTTHLAAKVPKFFYFDDYAILPGKVNLTGLAMRAANPGQLREEDRSVVSLLQLAGVSLGDLTAAQGYEQVKARLEGLSNSITDAVFRFWTQGRELDVEFDIRADPTDEPPFNVGPNLYLRIRDRRHRVSVPFSQRSKGFIWFFSFVVRFNAVKRQLGAGQQLVLLLDEPGLNLHALAQADFLRYIDDLAASHQVVYTTHSPFMLRGDRLHQVRLVEDRAAAGTVVTADVNAADPRTVYPLQAALGYAVARDLLPARRNLLVGGPAELIYLHLASAALKKVNRVGLRDDIAVVPVGGLDRLATFVTLLGPTLGATPLELVVLHDGLAGGDKLVPAKCVLGYGLFRDPAAKSRNAATAGDIEDLFAAATYLRLFHAAFEKPLGREVKEADLPPGDRVADRLARYLKDAGVTLRPGGGYDRNAVASHAASNPPKTLDKETLTRFEALFKRVNGLLSAA